MFPQELNVIINDKNIEVDLPKNLTAEDAKYMNNWQGKIEIICKPKPKTSKTKIISGGTKERRLEYLKVLLKYLGLFNDPGTLDFDRKTLMHIDYRITMESTQEDVDKLEDLNLKQFKNYQKITTPVTIDEFTLEPVTFGPATAAYIITTFSDENAYNKFTVTFSDENEGAFLIKLNIPVEIYATIQHNFAENTYTLKFKDFEGYPAKTAHDMILRIIDTLKHDYMIKLRVIDADACRYDKEIAKILNDNGCYMAYASDFDLIEEDITNSDIYIFSKFGESNKEKMKNAAEEIFRKLELHMCKKCQHVYNDSNMNCFLFKHSGQRIPFDSGEMEEFDEDEVDENGDPVPIYKYTCCGEVYANDDGCTKIENGEHLLDPNSKDLSKFEITYDIKYDEKF